MGKTFCPGRTGLTPKKHQIETKDENSQGVGVSRPGEGAPFEETLGSTRGNFGRGGSVYETQASLAEKVFRYGQPHPVGMREENVGQKR